MFEHASELASGTLRELFREWLDTNCPQRFRRPADRLLGAEALEWHHIRNGAGLVAPGWPTEFGGLGLGIDQQLAWHDALEEVGVARWFEQGVTMLGPTLIKHGSPEQRAHILPKILSGEQVWCQGYSEPGAGSDLAALRTRAVRDRDTYRVTGQKIWTSAANHSTHCFMLVRTSSEGRKQEGISFLLVDLSTPGITIRPIRNLAGHDELCEVFYDDVVVPSSNLVGAEGEGWTIAKSLLGFERLAIGNPAPVRLTISTFRKAAEALGRLLDPLVVEELGKLEIRLQSLNFLFRETAAAFEAGEPIEMDLSVLKITQSELWQEAAAALLSMAREHGATGILEAAGESLDLAQLYLTSRPATIYGGTNEIQRNILAKRWLDLPAV